MSHCKRWIYYVMIDIWTSFENLKQALNVSDKKIKTREIWQTRPKAHPDLTCTAKGQMVPGGRAEFHTADIGFGLDAGHWVIKIGRPQLHWNTTNRHEDSSMSRKDDLLPNRVRQKEYWSSYLLHHQNRRPTTLGPLDWSRHSNTFFHAPEKETEETVIKKVHHVPCSLYKVTRLQW